MPGLIEVQAAGSLQILTSYVLLVFSKPVSERPRGQSNVLTFGEGFTIFFSAFPVVYTVRCFTSQRVLDSVVEACHLASYSGC